MNSQCKHLRHKSMYVPADNRPVEQVQDSGTAVFWCNRTMGVVGPDGGFCSAEDCKENRKCFEDGEAVRP